MYFNLDWRFASVGKSISRLSFSMFGHIKIYKDGNITMEIVEHKTSQISEQERVKEQGAVLIDVQGELRVDGELSITRALGKSGSRPATTIKPDYKWYSTDDLDQATIVIASDGVRGNLIYVDPF